MLCTTWTYTVNQVIHKNYEKYINHLRSYTKKNSLDKILQVGTLDIGLSDHQLIYWTRKKFKEKNTLYKIY